MRMINIKDVLYSTCLFLDDITFSDIISHLLCFDKIPNWLNLEINLSYLGPIIFSDIIHHLPVYVKEYFYNYNLKINIFII